MSLQDDSTLISIVDSPPLMPIPISNHLIKRVPSLTQIYASEANLTPLLSESPRKQEIYYSYIEQIVLCCKKYEKTFIHILLKLLLHILLISIFESLFFFMYVSSLENNGVENTMDTFTNNAVKICNNMTTPQIDLINSYLGPYINRTQVELDANIEFKIRENWNERIMIQSWIYVGVLSGLFCFVLLYGKLRSIYIKWTKVIIENIFMVILLAVYEMLFFNTIIFRYLPLSSSEISNDTVQKLHNQCHLF